MNRQPLGIVISGFPGCGKSHCNIYGVTVDGIELTCSDSDSSKFGWIIDAEGKKVRNPNFIEEYINHIKEKMQEVDIVFVSTHIEVRKALAQEGIEHFLVYPDKSRKEEFLEKYRNRGSDDAFVEMLTECWEEWIDDIEKTDNSSILVKLEAPNMMDTVIKNIVRRVEK